MRDDTRNLVIPAKAAIHFDFRHVNRKTAESNFIPVFAEMTRKGGFANSSILGFTANIAERLCSRGIPSILRRIP